jgi:hypothetical protein
MPPETPPSPPSRRSLYLVAFGLLFAGFVVAIVAALHRPDYVVLVPMDETELAWFAPRLGTFAERHHVRLAARVYRDGAELQRLLLDDRRERRRRILAVLAPQDRLVALADSALVLPLSAFRDETRLAPLLRPFANTGIEVGQVGGQPYYLPGAFTTLCLYYSKSHVADAVEHWSDTRSTIEGWLREANGVGLPAHFALEPEPEKWDAYDVAVVAAYWAQAPFEGLTLPRVAHVTRPTGGLALDLATRMYGMGATADVLLALDSTPVRDALAWESFAFAHGLYHPAMAKQGLSAQDVCGAIAQGQVWLCALEPRELFRLHGLADDGHDGFVKDAADLGVVMLPRGSSLELTRGSIARASDAWSARGGVWWGIPARSPDAPLALALLELVTSAPFQLEQARALGWMSARGDLLEDLANTYRESWRYAIARPVATQLFKSSRPLPTAPVWLVTQDALAGAWQDACVTAHATVPLELEEAMRPHTQAIKDARR